MSLPEQHISSAQEQQSGGFGKYLLVYFCILAIAGLQFVVAYQHIDASQTLLRMLSLAILEAGLAVMFFMHLWAEKRSLLLCVMILTLFVLAALNFSWTDSFRLLVGAPFSKYH